MLKNVCTSHLFLSVTKTKLFETQIGLNEKEFTYIRDYQITAFNVSLCCEFVSSESSYYRVTFIYYLYKQNKTVRCLALFLSVYNSYLEKTELTRNLCLEGWGGGREDDIETKESSKLLSGRAARG